jgi:N-acetylated-alpha-linked acidic dipeptidase
MLRLADADLVPLRAQDFSATVGRYVEEIERYTDRIREEAQDNHRRLDDKLYELAASATDPVGPPARDADVPFLNFAPLRNAAAALATSARAFDAAYAAALADPARLTAARAAAANGLLTGAERALLGDPGLPGRPWYRHMVYAPGLYTGYGAKTLPAVREAIEERHWNEVAEAVTMTGAALDAYRRALDAAAAALR